MPNSDSNPNAFGQLTRFWRATLGLSQAQLAERVEAAPRHISFLETGRSNPTREMVLRIAQSLELPERDTGTLLIAAGFTVATSELDLHAPHNQALKQSLTLLLNKHDPYPALIINNIGDVLMCNQSWLAMLHYAGLDSQLDAPVVNLFHLYFSEDGLRQGIENWEELACFILLKIKEQQLLTGDSKLEELSEWLQAYPGLPKNWAKRARGIRSTSLYDIHYKDNAHRFSSRTLVTGVEPGRNETYSQLELHSYFPLDAAAEAFWQQLSQQP